MSIKQNKANNKNSNHHNNANRNASNNNRHNNNHRKEISTITNAHNMSASLRTTIPQYIAEELIWNSGDILIWTVEKEGKEYFVKVRRLE